MMFKQEVESKGFQKTVVVPKENDYSFQDFIILYGRYLRGEYELAHLKKNVSKAHVNQQMRYVTYFAKVVKKRINIAQLRITDVTQFDVSEFYRWAEPRFMARTFNTMFQAVRAFFDFVIDIERMEMRNPFNNYESKSVSKGSNDTLTKNEFELILNSVDTVYPLKKLGGRGEYKNMFRPYLKNGWRLLLLTGGRREEVVDLKWNMIKEINGLRFFQIHNLKVERASENKDAVYKYIPIGMDLQLLLEELGYAEKKGLDAYILHPNRTETSKTIMDALSKSFSFYKDEIGITSNVSMKNLRKTYISWAKAVLEGETKLLTSHSTDDVLERHYIDPTILSAIEKAVLEVRIFGD